MRCSLLRSRCATFSGAGCCRDFSVATLGIAWLLAFITRWIINAILLVITDKLTDHLKIDSFGWALGGALVMSLVGTLGEWLVRAVF